VLRAVIDTNVWISALLGAGAPKRLKDYVEQKRFLPVYSLELMDELVEVLTRRIFVEKFTQEDVTKLISLIKTAALLVEITEPFLRARIQKMTCFWHVRQLQRRIFWFFGHGQH
jgi:putative PIN family toxin of toxin-antitoxin system